MAIKTSKSNEAYQSRYKTGNLYKVHRKAKLERLLKEQPNNKQIELAIQNLTNYRRKTPKDAYWSHSMIEIAKLYKLFTGVFNKDIFSQKTEDQEAARRTRNSNLFQEDNKKQNIFKKRVSEFSLAARAHDKYGNLVWA